MSFHRQRKTAGPRAGQRVGVLTRAGLALLLIGIAASVMPAAAEEVAVETVLSPQEQIRLNFEDGSGHFVLMVRREGTADGTGPFAGAKVVEYGFHDIVRGQGGHPIGYLEVTAPDGAVAYLKWQVRAIFVAGEEKPRLIDNGVWELAGGTGQFAGKRGLGTLVIKPVSKTDRLFILEGEIAQAP